ncbi:hypothetical protein EMIHUDRAFT_235671 [Emiliania huxleyi CCMP1516]|uniref:Uncharacterized protein n=2 Tax=Emiliania huxleyi TaxID=2903 RepID=A0A0D3JVL4_EMIH1|nr:hypothetical protein EMIHUDRAFT_235671 [Emiliania huxleyi CCMP1516]EOD27549.1 hypothetical protein EMIHUDRAFT_235671 [Emiliania huxleyi CCMP1516]|eukprot:XP_005779978.1 hypothetical protein EMIHUDRAFT_235671 [Emiliania huxleyi CCMP1516]
MPFDVWALATVARKLGFHCCGRWGPAVLVRLYDATVGSSLASPATSLHGSWLDGSLLSTLPGLDLEAILDDAGRALLESAPRRQSPPRVGVVSREAE